jgi:membrane protein YdbS with pleckstrin-like domain
MEVMTGYNRMLTRAWLLLALAVVLIASHALVLRYALQHKSLSAAMVTGIVILVVMTHLGLLSRLFAFFRRRSRQ